MRAESRHEPRAIHATAVAIDDRALLISGASRSGKSRLACALISRATPARPIRLVGDDRIRLSIEADSIVARPHPRIAGFIERRGLGLVAMPWVPRARVGGLVHLRPPGAPQERPAVSQRNARNYLEDRLAELPHLDVDDSEGSARIELVLAWWAELGATWAPHPIPKADDTLLACAKD